MSEHQYISKPEESKKVTSETGSNETATSFEGASYDFGPGAMALESRQAAADDSPRSNSITQLQAMADDSVDNDSYGILQLQSMTNARATTLNEPTQKKENNTGLPDNLNDDVGLEKEADATGKQTLQLKLVSNQVTQLAFNAEAPGTYDDDGGHAMQKHGPAVDESFHKSRAEINAPSYSSSGWASEDKMKSAVIKAKETHTNNPDAKKSKGVKWKKKWTVNVNLKDCGYTWKYDEVSKTVNKIPVDTAVVIFSVNEITGDIVKMTTAFPGNHTNSSNATT